MRANRRALRGAEDGVTDVLGSILLVAITVTMMTSLSIVVLSIDGPADIAHAELRFDALPGTLGWGTGDEVIRVTHLGGEPVPASAMKFVFTVGTTRHIYGPIDLDQDFSDGRLTIGESWTRTFTILETDAVSGTAIFDEKSVMKRASIRNPLNVIDCSSDIQPPTAVIMTQDPADVTSITTSSVIVTITLADACSGPNDALAPDLRWKIGADPFTTETMFLSAPGQWTGTIPYNSWVLRSSETLTYQVVGFEDNNGNSGDSPTKSDLINVYDPNQYVASYSDVTGVTTNFPAAQSAPTPGDFATLNEQGGSVTTYALGSGGSATNPTFAQGPPDSQRAAVGNGQVLDLNTFTNTGSGTITKVELVVVSNRDITISDDVLQIRANAGDGYVVVNATHFPQPTFDETQSYNITGIKSGAWSWGDVAGIDVRSEYVKTGGPDGGSFRVNSMAVVVTASNANSLNIEFHWGSLPPLPNHELQLSYRTGGETFNVEVWNFTSSNWQQRGSLNALAFTPWSYTLTADESSGDPKIRFLDTNSNPPATSLDIEYARVVNS